ncbi:MAG: DUF2141 domain-containing protein [Alphaproteobacteria bacterium]|nr:DUF2141 domain-containing protein [Alphaproteobacteria bacterium]
MRQCIIAVLALPAIASATPTDGAKAELTITAAGIAPLAGQVRVAAFCSERAYRAFQADAAVVLDASAASVAATLTVPAGECAVLVHHDVDGDGRLTRGLFGIPSEPTAASGDARGLFGPPAWARARVRLTEGSNALTVRLSRP